MSGLQVDHYRVRPGFGPSTENAIASIGRDRLSRRVLHNEHESLSQRVQCGLDFLLGLGCVIGIQHATPTVSRTPIRRASSTLLILASFIVQ